jgi:hypothetical protein
MLRVYVNTTMSHFQNWLVSETSGKELEEAFLSYPVEKAWTFSKAVSTETGEKWANYDFSLDWGEYPRVLKNAAESRIIQLKPERIMVSFRWIYEISASMRNLFLAMYEAYPETKDKVSAWLNSREGEIARSISNISEQFRKNPRLDYDGSLISSLKSEIFNSELKDDLVLKKHVADLIFDGDHDPWEMQIMMVQLLDSPESRISQSTLRASFIARLLQHMSGHTAAGDTYANPISKGIYPAEPEPAVLAFGNMMKILAENSMTADLDIKREAQTLELISRSEVLEGMVPFLNSSSDKKVNKEQITIETSHSSGETRHHFVSWLAARTQDVNELSIYDEDGNHYSLERIEYPDRISVGYEPLEMRGIMHPDNGYDSFTLSWWIRFEFQTPGPRTMLIIASCKERKVTDYFNRLVEAIREEWGPGVPESEEKTWEERKEQYLRDCWERIRYMENSGQIRGTGRRRHNVLKLLLEGASHKEIYEELNRTEATVHGDARWLRENGFFPMPENSA